MKIDLTMNGKQYFDPLFKVLYSDEKTHFLLGITKKNITDYSFIIEDFLHNLIEFRIENQKFIFETNEKIFMFELGENFLILPKNKDFNIGIVLLDNNDKIIEQEYQDFTANIHENNNK